MDGNSPNLSQTVRQNSWFPGTARYCAISGNLLALSGPQFPHPEIQRLVQMVSIVLYSSHMDTRLWRQLLATPMVRCPEAGARKHPGFSFYNICCLTFLLLCSTPPVRCLRIECILRKVLRAPHQGALGGLGKKMYFLRLPA